MTGRAMPVARDVLIVDDDDTLRELLFDAFSGQGYGCHCARDGADGLKQFEALRPGLTITDLKMPVLDGREFLRRALLLDPDAAIIVLTGFGDVPVAVESLRRGAYHFVLKPVSLDELLITAERALERRDLLLAQREYETLLNRRVAEATSALSAMTMKLEGAYTEILGHLAVALSPHGETQASLRRVQAYAAALADAQGASTEAVAVIQQAALLRDIGYSLIPRSLLADPASAEYAEAVERHPEMSRLLLEPVPALHDAAAIVQSHHERWDGTGYPARLRGEAIPPGARIVAVAEALEVMMVRHPEPADPLRRAREDIALGAGTQFDPRVIEMLMGLAGDRLEAIRQRRG